MVYILLGDGFEEVEAAAPYDILKRGGVSVNFAGVNGKEVVGSHGIKFTAECLVSDIDLEKAEMVIVPGGMGGVESIENSPKAMDTVLKAHKKGIEVAAICAGPRVLAKLGIINGVRIVCYPGLESEMTGAEATQESATVRSEKITTGRGPGAALDFGFEVLKVLRGEKAAKTVADAMYYDWK